MSHTTAVVATPEDYLSTHPERDGRNIHREIVMGKAGGILGIIAGVLGLVAGAGTLFLGGLGAAFSANGANTIMGLGWGGIVFSLLTLIYGGIALAKPKPGGMGLLLSAVGGAVLGGTFVALAMALALVGGILALAAKTESQDSGSGRKWPGLVGAAVAPLFFLLVFGSATFNTIKTDAGGAKASEPEKRLRIGELARSSQFEVAVQNVEVLNSVGRGFGAAQAEPGTMFVALRVSVRCIDNESRFYSPGDLFGQANGQEVKYDHPETIFGLDSPMGQINPMMEKIGFVVYKIPAQVANGPLTWAPGSRAGNQRFALNGPQPAPDRKSVV